MKRILAALLVVAMLLAAAPMALAAEEATGGIAAGMKIEQVTPQTVVEKLKPSVPKRASTRAVGDSMVLPSVSLENAAILMWNTSTLPFTAYSAGNPAPEWGYVALYKGDAYYDPHNTKFVKLLHCKRISATEGIENFNCTLRAADLAPGCYTLISYVSDRGDGNGEILGDPYGAVISIVGYSAALQDISFYTTNENGTEIPVAGCVLVPGEVNHAFVRFNPENATVDRGLTFTISDSSVATIEVVAGVVAISAVKHGTATITAKSTATGKTATLPVEVSVPVTGLELDRTEVVNICPDNEVTLQATVSPAEATVPVTWTTSNGAVATVKNGVVKTVESGKVVITAHCAGYSASCKFTVRAHDNGASRQVQPTATRDGGTVATCKICGKDNYLKVEPRIFADTYGTAYYSDAVDYCYENGIIKGTKADRFSPDMNMTRGMLVAVLYRTEGSPAVDTLKSFPDVSEKQYYAPAVVWANQNKLVTGYTNGQFKPDGNITREEIATIMRRYAEYKKRDVTVEGDKLADFPDGLKEGYWSYEAMNWAVSIGLINGNKVSGKTYLQPSGLATRAQVATILYRFIQMEAAE